MMSDCSTSAWKTPRNDAYEAIRKVVAKYCGARTNEVMAEVEKYTLPRPVTKDEVPIRRGMDLYGESDNKKWKVLKIGEFGKNSNGGRYPSQYQFIGRDNEGNEQPLKARWMLSEPRVLDADGVEVKIGDTVYYIDDSRPRTVTGFNLDHHFNVHYTFENNIGGESNGKAPAKLLTHTPPDSLDRIIEDMRKQIAEWHTEHPISAIEQIYAFERIRDRPYDLRGRE